MRQIIKIIFNLIFPKYGRYIGIILKNNVMRILKPNIENEYLFILSPQYCGSTLLNEIISTSKFVSVNNTQGNREGQTLPTTKKIMFDGIKRWDTSIDFDWKLIRKEWMKYWDTTKPILLEKSPPNLIRAASINKAFPNSKFIIFYRNPYAHCESLIKRSNRSPKWAAEHAIKCLRFQKINMDLLLKFLVVSYEDLTENPMKFRDQLIEFIPAIKDVKTNIKFSAHNFKEEVMEIKNLNNEKISKLSSAQLIDINKVFNENKEILEYFNYKII